ncbi:MAG TPA: META domain-containing protein [Acidimicrobiia bacterium]|nr:META domain-containing protein [Acidimicrobiia bacterium]
MLVTVFLAACGGGVEDDPTGRTWQLVELERSALVEATSIDLTIDDEQASGSSGCNSYTGPASVSDGEMALGPDFAVTFMACGEEVMSQEQRYLEALTRVTAYEMASTQLTLKDAQGIVLLTFNG